MKEHLNKLNFYNIGLINIVLFSFIVVFGKNDSYVLLLTVAQLIYVPFMLFYILKNESNWFAKSLPYISLPGYLSIVALETINDVSPYLSLFYFLFTLFIACYGVTRFLNRGFVHSEEIVIDFALIYISVGGGWYVAHHTGIETGFPPILVWLTSIHFHYAAFLFPLFVGYLGRLYKPNFYKWVSILVIVAPIVTALGITFSRTLEVISTLLYIIAIFSVIVLSFYTKWPHVVQKWFIRISFMSLGITIIFSLLYAYSNWSEVYSITIEFMILFHGVTNAVVFALFGVLGWMIQIPKPTYNKPNFPVSQIKGKGKIGHYFLDNIRREDKRDNGLVNNMNDYVSGIHSMIKDFYESTSEYRLIVRVKWRAWFIPFAVLYRLFSKYTEQINLPLTSKPIEMTGGIISVDDQMDGREDVRAWHRKIGDETVFLALYSKHVTKGKTYMNIALPLPFSTMIGILDLYKENDKLVLTSRGKSGTDAGIYLSFSKYFMRLPIEEQFIVREKNGKLLARHKMWIFSIPFLLITYEINKK